MPNEVNNKYSHFFFFYHSHPRKVGSKEGQCSSRCEARLGEPDAVGKAVGTAVAPCNTPFPPVGKVKVFTLR